MKKIIFATQNKNKLVEIRQILDDFDVEIISMADAGIDIEIDENGTTFEENALIKAETVGKVSHEIVLADDSGLSIDYLNGEPGIYSARYMGRDTSYDQKNANLISRLDGVPDEKRTARFVCAVAAAFPDEPSQVVRGTIEGIIAHRPAGSKGFGYDPIFYVPEYGMTTAQMTPEMKNSISHRGKALRLIRPVIGAYLERHGESE